jgi:23S rRNA (cytosine1962-C5)-methyltransferase
MSLPTCTISLRAAKKLRAGHPWVQRPDVLTPPRAEGGEVVRLVDEKGQFHGIAFWGAKSPIALRLLSREEVRVDAAFFERRISQAVERRRRLFPKADAFRAVHGEADLLPGLFADRYGDGLGVQLLSEGAERHRELLLAALVKVLSPRVMALRNDTGGREFEGLSRETTLVHGNDPVCRYHEGENLFEIDLLREKKTGAFLDQQENHVRAGEIAFGEALDTFTYHGGFALAMARRATSVLALDQDQSAVDHANNNAALNGLTNFTARAENAFDALHSYDREGRRFDTIVIDPPGFAKRKEGLETALRAYRELNLRALKILRPGGYLISCSCSGRVTPQAFEAMLLEAAADAQRPVQLLERRGAGRDHPVMLGLPETEYLKCFILQVPA